MNILYNIVIQYYKFNIEAATHCCGRFNFFKVPAIELDRNPMIVNDFSALAQSKITPQEYAKPQQEQTTDYKPIDKVGDLHSYALYKTTSKEDENTMKLKIIAS